MTDDLVNQLTLNFLISKQQLQKLNKKTKEVSCKRKIIEIQEYSNRIRTLFADLLVCEPPEDLLFEVKSAFDNFIEKSIYYFKAHDNTENLEKDRNGEIHDDIDFEKDEREIEKGNYKELSNYEDENEHENEHENEYENEHENEDENENEFIAEENAADTITEEDRSISSEELNPDTIEDESGYDDFRILASNVYSDETLHCDDLFVQSDIQYFEMNEEDEEDDTYDP